jgi:predicted DNA-binding transcriptional regulator AlpA
VSETNQTRWVGIPEIVGRQGKPGLLPISRSRFYELLQEGRLPKPQKLGRRSLWREQDLIAAVEKLLGEG